MKRFVYTSFSLLFSTLFSLNAFALVPVGVNVTSDLKIGAVIYTEEQGEIEALWSQGGEDTTARGDRVVWGFFYANPANVSWGTVSNPEVYVKVWFDASGRVDVNFFHVSVPDIEVFSDYVADGTYDLNTRATVDTRYIRQFYENGTASVAEQDEDGLPVSGYSQANNPVGYYSVGGSRLGAVINTEEAGAIHALWREGGRDVTQRGDQVVWGYFYANPNEVSWGSINNPEVFVKIWSDVNGMTFMNYFHVSVPDVEVYSEFPADDNYDQTGTTIQSDRYIRHDYERSSAGRLTLANEDFNCYKKLSFVEDYTPSFSFDLTNQLDRTISRIDMHLLLTTPNAEVPWAEGDGRYDIPGGLTAGQTESFALEPNIFFGFGDDAKDNVCDDPTRRDYAINNNHDQLQFVMYLTAVYDANDDKIEP